MKRWVIVLFMLLAFAVAAQAQNNAGQCMAGPDGRDGEAYRKTLNAKDMFALSYWSHKARLHSRSVLPTPCEACIEASQDMGLGYLPTMEQCRRACGLPPRRTHSK